MLQAGNPVQRIRLVLSNPKAFAFGAVLGLMVGIPIRMLRQKELEEKGGGPWNGPLRSWWFGDRAKRPEE